jgi:nitroimidazol reductase NimA-like FMN-containing flavoprotein (pyridoxamine 5'-phosphate oxidase superfamily)
MSSEPKREILRKPSRTVTDRDEAYAILDEGYIAHVGFADPDTGETTVIPIAYARDGDRMLLHGSTGSRVFMALKAGVQVCATVTHLDAMISARSPFNSSMNYRSVMVFGTPRALEDEEKERALYIVSEHLVAGLWDAGRPMVAKEFAQTMAVELSLKDMTAKKRVGGALDDEDAQLPIWAGQIPIKTTFGTPIPNPECADMPLPDYIKKIVESN